jgi:hypothetical protein
MMTIVSIIVIPFVSIIFFRYIYKYRKLSWLRDGPLPPIFQTYPKLITRPLNEKKCKPYKLNEAGLKILNKRNLYCETICIILSSSATLRSRAVKIYKLIMQSNNNNANPKKLCVFILSDEIDEAESSSINIPIISRSSNSSRIAEFLYDWTFNYVSALLITIAPYFKLLFISNKSPTQCLTGSCWKWQKNRLSRKSCRIYNIVCIAVFAYF